MKRIFWVLVLLAALFSLSACGGGGSNGGTSSAPPNPGPDPQPTVKWTGDAKAKVMAVDGQDTYFLSTKVGGQLFVEKCSGENQVWEHFLQGGGIQGDMYTANVMFTNAGSDFLTAILSKPSVQQIIVAKLSKVDGHVISAKTFDNCEFIDAAAKQGENSFQLLLNKDGGTDNYIQVVDFDGSVLREAPPISGEFYRLSHLIVRENAVLATGKATMAYGDDSRLVVFTMNRDLTNALENKQRDFSSPADGIADTLGDMVLAPNGTIYVSGQVEVVAGDRKTLLFTIDPADGSFHQVAELPQGRTLDHLTADQNSNIYGILEAGNSVGPEIYKFSATGNLSRFATVTAGTITGVRAEHGELFVLYGDAVPGIYDGISGTKIF